MNFHFRLMPIFFVFPVMWKTVSPARILAVFPFPLASHCMIQNTVTAELAKRGHELVVFSGCPVGDKVSEMRNYRGILLEENAKLMPDISELFKGKSILMIHWEVHKLTKIIGEATIKHSDMMKMISPNSEEKFDLIIIEWMHWGALNALGYRFNAPVIGIVSIPANIFGGGAMEMGLPFNMIDRPSYMDGIDGEKTFFQRLSELIMEIEISAVHHWYLPGQQEIVEKYFGKNYPHVYNLIRNVSMIFGTQDDVMPYPTVGVPNMKNMGGIHVTKEFDQVLPKNMKDFMDGGKKGVIYFSLGSTMKGVDTPKKVRNVFRETFAELDSYRVLWKWENETLPGKPKNVFTSKWMPQRAILAHPSVKVFVTQGGLQSTEEAMFAGVPLVGIPLQGDQFWNVNKMVSVGSSLRLDIDRITEEKLKAAILEVINNETYKQRIVEFRDLVNDRPYDPVNNTMWWIEYVIRNKGAHHIKIARANLSWYQANHIDTLGFIFLAISLTILFVFRIMKIIFLRLFFGRKVNAGTTKLKHS